MKTRTRWRLLAVIAPLVLAVAAFAVPRPALAVSTTASVRNVAYTTTLGLSTGIGMPYTGTMRLNFNNGYINGWYTDTSIRPGSPLRRAGMVSVQGAVTPDGRTHFTIGRLSFIGTLHGHIIRCSTTLRGQLYTFVAQQH